MCLFSRRPNWEDEVVFANRPRHRSRTQFSETIVTKQTRRSSPEYLPAPPVQSEHFRSEHTRSEQVIIKPTTPPPQSKMITARPASPAETIALVRVQEDRIPAPEPSKSSTSVSKKSRRSSRGGDEVYIERERIRERIAPPLPPSPKRGADDYDTYRYVEAPSPPPNRYAEEEGMARRRSRSITYETNPRTSNRVVERERVVVEDGGRRREYYRRP